ncbi:MAG: hypothetical protein IVW53_11910 [Chloroflexi bacterium]|nr:hypothetical protein [Chloroflexota bacterium]
MRPRNLVAGAALTAALALVALPGLVGSRTPSPDRPLEAAAFRSVTIDATGGGSSLTIPPLDAALRSASALSAGAQLVEAGSAASLSIARPKSAQPIVLAAYAIKPPRSTLRGVATFYDNGTTAMRLPRGTIIRVCGPGGCIDRVVTDYGPIAGTDRIVDLYRPDFFAVCGCPSWSGTMSVTIGVY